MATATALGSARDVSAFIEEYFTAWGGTDEDRILSYYTEDIALEFAGTLMKGTGAVREQLVRPILAGFPGNRHIVRNLVVGQGAIAIEWRFEAQHKGQFAGVAATGVQIEMHGCSVYELDSVNRKITGGRIYFEMTSLLKQIGAA